MPVLTAPHMERCIGCLLCVLQAGWPRGVVSLANSPIKIISQKSGFKAEIDSGIHAGEELEKIVLACPRNCLKVEES